jgi:hypothetical protein
MEVSKMLAESLNCGPWMSRLIRSWTSQYKKKGMLVSSKRGKHQKIKSALNDEDIQIKISQYLRSKKVNFRLHDFINHVSDVILPSLGYEKEKKISDRTAHRWLSKMGWSYNKYRKDIYVDGHERDDVVEYREKFLDQMKIYERYMPIFDGENMEQVTWPSLNSDEKIHILVTHDESIFFSNDGLDKFWGPNNEQPLRPKNKGASLHVSEFLCEPIGRLRLGQVEKEHNSNLPENERIPEDDACTIIRPGINRDGYWTSDNLVDQVRSIYILFIYLLSIN